MEYWNLQLIYNFTVSSKTQEEEILSQWEKAGRPLEELPHFEVKEVKRQSAEKAVAEALSKD